MGAGTERRAGRQPLRLLLTVAGATSATALAACSVLLDWSGFSSGNGSEGGHPMMGPDDATVDTDAGTDAGPDDANILAADAPPLQSCGGGGLCSPPLPVNAPGWSGPYALSVGAPGSLLPCSTPSYEALPVFEGNYGLKADPPKCGCSCSAPQGRGCDPPKVTFYADSTCTTVCDAGLVNGCLAIPSCAGSSGGTANFLDIGNTMPSASGSCAPDGSVAVAQPSWAGAAHVCQLASGAIHDTCGSSEYCLPASTPYCILFAGDAGAAPCPAGDWYVHRHVFYSGVNDQRGCTSCTCGAPEGGACSFPTSQMAPVPLAVGSFDSTCQLPLGQPFFVPSPCTAKVPTAFGLRTVLDAGLVEAGTCQPSTVAPLEAGAVPLGATTLCCTQ